MPRGFQMSAFGRCPGSSSEPGAGRGRCPTTEQPHPPGPMCFCFFIFYECTVVCKVVRHRVRGLQFSIQSHHLPCHPRVPLKRDGSLTPASGRGGGLHAPSGSQDTCVLCAGVGEGCSLLCFSVHLPLGWPGMSSQRAHLGLCMPHITGHCPPSPLSQSPLQLGVMTGAHVFDSSRCWGLCGPDLSWPGRPWGDWEDERSKALRPRGWRCARSRWGSGFGARGRV